VLATLLAPLQHQPNQESEQQGHTDDQHNQAVRVHPIEGRRATGSAGTLGAAE